MTTDNDWDYDRERRDTHFCPTFIRGVKQIPNSEHGSWIRRNIRNRNLRNIFRFIHFYINFLSET